MDKRILKILKIVFMVCLVILILELFYLTYISFFKEKKSIYFDAINAMDSTVSDGYVVVGSNNNNDMHYEKAKITKYNSKKEKVFEVLYNKGFNSAFFDVAVDDTDFIAVGSYEADDSEHEKGIREAIIVKYDKTGKVLFDKSFKALDDSKFVSVYVLDDGYLVAGQSIYEKMTLGLSNSGGAYLIKYDKVGNVVWKSNYGDNKAAIFNDVISVNNSIYVVGRDASRVGLINRYDMNGNLIKSSGYEYTDSLGLTSLVAVDDGIVATGAKKYVDDKNNSIVDALLIKYDFECNYLDEVTYDNNCVERFNRVIKDSNGNLVVVGNEVLSYTSTEEDNNNNLLYNGLIGKYKGDLSNIKLETYGAQRDDHFTDIKVVDNNYCVVGYSSYEDGSYLSKFIVYSDALKVLEVQG